MLVSLQTVVMPMLDLGNLGNVTRNALQLMLDSGTKFAPLPDVRVNLPIESLDDLVLAIYLDSTETP